MTKEDSVFLFRPRKGQISTQELIFRTLSRTYPCTIAVLREKLRLDFHTKLSFQAVRQCVLGLKRSHVIERTEQGYQLSLAWVLQVRATLDQTIATYRGTKRAALDEALPYQTFDAGSLYEADSLWGDILLELCKSRIREQRSHVFSLNHYPWWLPLNLGREADLFMRIQKLGYKISFVFTSKGLAARWAASIYKDFGVATLLGQALSIEANCYYNVIGDTVIRTTIPVTLHKKIEKAFGKISKKQELSNEQISQLGYESVNIQIAVFKSPPLSKALLLPFKMK